MSDLALPFFYINHFDSSQKVLALDEDNSRHIIQVLRMQKGELLNLTDGKGNLLTAEITAEHKKHCEVVITDATFIASSPRKTAIGISLIKNASRFEWFLEKATELGISEIIPLITARTEKQKFRIDRMNNILVSAMLQSQQCWLPVLHEPTTFNKFISDTHQQQKFIAHCLEDNKQSLQDAIDKSISSQLIVIGPEGDFSQQEIELALQNHFTAVSLGDTRLRTETAGIVAATLLKLS